MKEFLSQRGVPYVEKNITENPAWQTELEAMGYMAVPVTIIGERHLLGFKREELEGALQEAGL